MSAATRREASVRDGDQCAFVSADGRRCTERAFLEFHHKKEYGHRGRRPATDEHEHEHGHGHSHGEQGASAAVVRSA